MIAIKILATRLPTKPRLYWLTLALAGCLAIYMAIWFLAVLLAVTTDNPSRMFNADVREILHHLTATDLALCLAIVAASFVTVTLFAMRHAACAIPLMAAVLLHITLWIRLTAHPVYDASIGLLVITLEILILMLILRLWDMGRKI
ncbi:hypothetical protein [Maricaulis maris]|uniref:hypothetical protein n=1 Tax=Maricaulis maris TaxID=74318 RepID=UPI003B8D05BD